MVADHYKIPQSIKDINNMQGMLNSFVCLNLSKSQDKNKNSIQNY